MVKQLVYDNRNIADVFVADTFLKRFTGYMLRRRPHYGAILITPCSSIHTFFMRFHIDVLFLNSDMEIVKKAENLGPGKVIPPVKHGSMVLEAPAGILSAFSVGDKIALGDSSFQSNI